MTVIVKRGWHLKSILCNKYFLHRTRCQCFSSLTKSINRIHKSNNTWNVTEMINNHGKFHHFLEIHIRNSSFLTSCKPAPQYQPERNGNYSNNNGNVNGNGSSDLFTFLHEIGTTPKEARYWLKEFNRSAKDLSRPFGIIQIDRDVLLNEKLRYDLFESIAFIHRNGMKCVLIHGSKIKDESNITSQDLKILRSVLSQDSEILLCGLEAQNTPVRLIYPGTGVLEAEAGDQGYFGSVSQVDMNLLQNALDMGHIPIIQGFGISQTGQLLALDVDDVTKVVTKRIVPLKVMIVNTTGGFTNQYNEIVANINIPEDLELLMKAEWFTTEHEEKVTYVTELLNLLPGESSVVLTSASKILTELFSHHGAGTFFKIPEPIEVHNSLNQIDLKKLEKLIAESFSKDLDDSYFNEIKDRIHRIYLSKEYNAVAIITKEEDLDVPYLDKFAVTLTQQGHGQGEMLWNSIKKDYKKLFWRSKHNNRINNWYFQKSSSFVRHSSGSWSDGTWMVFWFGVDNHQISSKLVDFCLNKPSTFTNCYDVIEP